MINGLITPTRPSRKLPNSGKQCRMTPRMIHFCLLRRLVRLVIDNVYELADFKRSFLWDLDRLAKPLAYHAEIHPTKHAAEQAARERKTAKKKKK